MSPAMTLAWTDILEEHASEAGFLFDLRTTAFGCYRRGLASLTDLEERLQAHLDGLEIAPAEAWELVEPGLGSESAGEAFVAAWLALGVGGGPPLDALETALAAPASLDGLAGALRLSRSPHAAAALRRFAAAALPLPRALALDALALRGEDVPAAAARALLAVDHPVAILAGVGIATRRQHAELRAEVARFRTHAHPRVASAALQAMALLHDPGAAAACREALARQDAAGATALRLLGMIGEPADAARLAAAARAGACTRLATQALARHGLASAPEVLLALAADPPRSRTAGHGLELMMGLDLVAQRLAFPPGSEGHDAAVVEDEELKLDLDDGLAPPDPRRLQGWWERLEERPARDQRWRAGKPFAWESVLAEVERGTLPDRDDALLELMVRLPLGYLERRGWCDSLRAATAGLAREVKRQGREGGSGWPAVVRT